MAFDLFTLEDALQRGAQGLWADHGFILLSGDVAREAIFTTLANKLQVRESFLAGSVRRRTWATAKPELDMFVVLDDVHRGYLASSPSVIFEDIASALRHTRSFTRDKNNGRVAVHERLWRDNNLDSHASIVVLPAFAAGRGILVPDRWRDEWIAIDPGGFDPLARAADRSFPEWRALTRILKVWNNRDGLFEPYIQPGLLIDLMVMTFAKEARAPDLGTQLIALFELMFRHFDEEWPDPAGLVPPLTSYMTRARRGFAQEVLRHAWRTLAEAKRLDNGGSLREAKRLARSVLRGMVCIEPRDEDGEPIPRERLQKPKFPPPGG